MNFDSNMVAVGQFRTLVLKESELEVLVKNNFEFLLQLTEQDWDVVADCTTHYHGQWDQLLLDKYKCTISQLEDGSFQNQDDTFQRIKEMVLYEKNSGTSLVSLYPEREKILGTHVDKLRGELATLNKKVEGMTHQGEPIIMFYMFDEIQRTLIAHCANKYNNSWEDMVHKEYKTSLPEFLLLEGIRSTSLKMIIEYEKLRQVSLPLVYRQIEEIRTRLQKENE